MATIEYFTKEELIEKYDFLEDVELPRGIKLQEEGLTSKEGVVREFTTFDQLQVDKDLRAKNSPVYQAMLLVQRVFYVKVDEDKYRRLTNQEMQNIKGSDQNEIVKAMRRLAGESEDFLQE